MLLKFVTNWLGFPKTTYLEIPNNAFSPYGLLGMDFMSPKKHELQGLHVLFVFEVTDYLCVVVQTVCWFSSVYTVL